MESQILQKTNKHTHTTQNLHTCIVYQISTLSFKFKHMHQEQQRSESQFASANNTNTHRVKTWVLQEA